MRKRRLPGLTAAAALVSGVLLAGCTVQDQPQPPEPTASAPEASSATPAPVAGTYTGTQTFELGTPPEDATDIALEITCLDTGTLTLPSGAEVTCQDQGFSTGIWSFPLVPGQHSVEVQASGPGVSYEVKIAYADK